MHEHYGKPSPDEHVAGCKHYHSIIIKPFTMEVENVNSSASWCHQPNFKCEHHDFTWFQACHKAVTKKSLTCE